MNSDEINSLVERIGRLISTYLAEQGSSPVGTSEINGEQLRTMVVGSDHSPPLGSPSASEQELFAIGTKLGNEGGLVLMHEVHAAFEAEHGPLKAITLSARWDGAADWLA